MTARPTTAAQAPLNRSRIIITALDLTYRYGMRALSMRRIAAELDVVAMALYTHISGSPALPGLMAQTMLSRRADPDPALAWQEQLLHLLAEVYRVGVNSPAVVQVFIKQLQYLGIPGPGPDGDGRVTAAVGTEILTLLQSSVLPRCQQLPAARGLMSLLIGAMTAHLPQPAPLPPIPAWAPGPRGDRPLRNGKTKPRTRPLTALQRKGAAELHLTAHWLLTGASPRQSRPRMQLPPGLNAER